ncbi:ArsR family transcriptional regulator [Paenibacillus algicola]|uniref:ArsR family transcriptional regulator n=1 Tax=Paenibacillus algicola TaxID=2565926 RepID=A0A4P8XHT3_9BACL|nr:metalloregulator ArsR/SmtB family transcription factor [Paenibacillus algicola]QCT01000.1 ArsR family transcriptional regulator [Paenibacillus algicola]
MEAHEHSFLQAQTVEDVSRIFKALSDPTRIKILYMLAQEECTVGHITEVLDISHSAVSHQLSLLRTMRLVKSRREGTSMIYSCDDNHVISLLNQAVCHAEQCQEAETL